MYKKSTYRVLSHFMLGLRLITKSIIHKYHTPNVKQQLFATIQHYVNRTEHNWTHNIICKCFRSHSKI